MVVYEENWRGQCFNFRFLTCVVKFAFLGSRETVLCMYVSAYTAVGAVLSGFMVADTLTTGIYVLPFQFRFLASLCLRPDLTASIP